MTAKTKHGHKAHRRAHGSDEGSAHERLNRMHAMPNRAEGAPMSSAGAGAAPPGVAPPPQPQDNTAPMAPPGGAPAAAGGSDDESGEQT